MAKIQAYKVVKDGLVSLKDVNSVIPMQQGIDAIGNFMFPAKDKIFTDANAVQDEFRKSLMSGELRSLIEEGAIEPVEIESSAADIPEFNSKNKIAKQDLENLTVEQLEKILEEKKKAKLIKEIAETQKISEPSQPEVDNIKKDNEGVGVSQSEQPGVHPSVAEDPLLKDFSGLSYQEKLTYIAKTDDKAILKAIVSSASEISVIKTKALNKLAK